MNGSISKIVFAVFLPTFFSILSWGQFTPLEKSLPNPPQPGGLGTYGYPQGGNRYVEPKQANPHQAPIEQDVLRRQRQNAQIMRDVEEAERDFREMEANYTLPKCVNELGRKPYEQAFATLDRMLRSDTISLKRAVFVVENAFFENKMKYEIFNSFIKEYISICKWKLKHDGYKENDKLAKLFVLYQFFSDTIKYQDAKTKQWKTHYPFKYDFDDYMGKQDYSKQFVSKLMVSQSGQCHSMPLLFLILAEEWSADAYLSFSPSHTFVRYTDDKGKVGNIELTNGRLTSDSWIMASGFVKAEAIKNKIYLDTLSNKKIIAQCFVDLAQQYYRKYCHDEFTLRCSQKALDYFPNNIFALQVKSDYYTLLFSHVIKKIGMPPPQYLPDYPLANNIFITRNELYSLIDNMGYEPMPAKDYENWLQSVEEETNKQESERLKTNIRQAIKKD